MTAFALFFLLACGGAEQAADAEGAPEAEAPAAEAPAEAAPEAAGFEMPAEIEQAMTVCMGAVDCVAVQLTCGCEDDGWIAVNKSNAEAAKDKYGQKECAAEAGECAAPEATCMGGCKLQ